MKPKTVNLIQVNVAVLIWAGTSMFAKGIDLPVGPITFFRSVVALAVLWAFLAACGQSVKVNGGKHYAVMVVLGLLMCGHWLTYFQSLKVSTAAVAILSLHTYPVITALVEPFLFKEKLHWQDAVVAVLVFAGVVLMTLEITLRKSTGGDGFLGYSGVDVVIPVDYLSSEVVQGVILGIISGMFFLSRNLLIRKYVQQYSGSLIMFWQVVVATAVLWPLVLFDPGTGVAAGGGGAYTLKAILLLVLLGSFFTALPQTLYAASFKHLSAKTVGVLATLLPFYGAVMGYLLYGELVTLGTVIGGVVILGCIIYETLKHVKR